MSQGDPSVRYHGQVGGLFKLALWTSFLTLITLGIYRFWARTRIRRYIWSQAELDGDRFEYTGTGLEKFLGFLVAVVILAIYLGIVQMLLYALGLSLYIEPRTQAQALAQFAATFLTSLAVLPLFLFAYYRARRYKMARTRWRGIRFGMEKGAWGYVARALGHGALTVLTFGILLPRQTFWLEKYMADRSWFGDARLTQEGRWTALFPAMKHLFIGAGIVIAGVGAAAVTESPVLAQIPGVVGYVWFMIGLVHYRVQSFGYLTSHKVLEGDIRFVATPSTKEVATIYIFGGLVLGIGFAIGAAVLFGLFWATMRGVAFGQDPSVLVLIAMIVLYAGLLLALGAGYVALILQNVIGHFITSTRVVNLDAVDAIGQRAHDTGADAEGFADALDVGGAI